MQTFFKRVGAYFIDYMIVTVFIYMILLIPFVNPHQEQYNVKYNELINVNDQYTKNEISKEEYEEAFRPIAYEVYRLNINYVIISTVCFIIYFGVIQFLMKGQTVGKKLFHIQVQSVNDKELTMANYIIRTIVLYNILIPIIELIIVYTMNVDNYLPVYRNINLVGYIIMYITLFMVLVRQDGRGLHDLVGNTKVVYIESTEPKKEEKIIEVEPKEEVKKKTVKKTKKTEKKS